MIYAVIRHKHTPFPNKGKRKRKKDFGEFLNSIYNQNEIYNEKEEDTFYEKHCTYCNAGLESTYKEFGKKYFCEGCCCNKCGNFDENMKLLFYKNKYYICSKCIIKQQ